MVPSTDRAAWWIEEMRTLGYPTGTPLGGVFPVALGLFYRTAVALALGMALVPVSIVVRGGPPVGLVGVLFPLPFAFVGWRLARSLADTVIVTEQGLRRRDASSIDWANVTSMEISARQVSVAWADSTGNSQRLVRPRRRDLGDTRLDHLTLRPPR